MSIPVVPLHYEMFGQGQPLVILHGLFGSISNWRALAQQCGENYQVFAVDLRNHGRSPHSDDFTYAAMEEDLRAFIREQRLPSPYILGHSLGGKVAMHFALSYPEELKKLIVVDMTPRATPPRHTKVIAALQSLDFATATSRRELDAQLALKLPDAMLRQFLLMNVATDEDGRLGWRIDLDAIAAGYDATNDAIETTQVYENPALFIRGGKSDYIGAEDVAGIKALFPRAEIATVENAGHWVHAERPNEFLRMVEMFLTP